MKTNNNKKTSKKMRIGRLTVLVIAIMTAASLMMTGCLRSPVETGAVTNTEDTDVTPGETTTETTETTTEPETSETEPEQTDETDATDSETTTEPTETTAPTKEPRPEQSSITIELEGMPEQIVTNLYMSKLGYSMYYDKDRYKVVETSSRFDSAISVDEYMPVTPADALPDIYMQVGYFADMSAEKAFSELTAEAEQKLSAKASEPMAVIIGVDNLPGQKVTVVSGHNWDSEVIAITVIDDGRGGSFFFYGGYFLEAEEGHGSRYTQMLESFRIE